VLIWQEHISILRLALTVNPLRLAKKLKINFLPLNQVNKYQTFYIDIMIDNFKFVEKKLIFII